MDEQRARVERRLAVANQAANRAAMALEFLAGRTNANVHQATIGLVMAATDHAHEGRWSEAEDVLELMEV